MGRGGGGEEGDGEGGKLAGEPATLVSPHEEARPSISIRISPTRSGDC